MVNVKDGSGQAIYIYTSAYIDKDVCYVYNHPEVDRIWGLQEVYHGSFEDHILFAPGWLYIHIFYIYLYIYICSYRIMHVYAEHGAIRAPVFEDPIFCGQYSG